MSERSLPLAGWDDIEAAPRGLKAEVIGGELFLMSRPRLEHGIVQANLAGNLSMPFGSGRGGPGGWWLANEPDIRFGPHDIVSPDMAGWQRERLPEIPDQQPIDLAPDWVCEVLSPSTAARDRRGKSDLYLRGGVRHYWLMDPSTRLLEGLEALDGRWTVLGTWGDGDVARVPPFEAVELRVGELFPALPSGEGGSAADAAVGDERSAGRPSPPAAVSPPLSSKP